MTKTELSKVNKSPKHLPFTIIRNQVDPFLAFSASTAENKEYWKWGDDNLFPCALSLLSRRSAIHRRIIIDKSRYIAGKGISYDLSDPVLTSSLEQVNGTGETVRQLLRKLAFDKTLFGNAFLEIVTDKNRSFISFFHQDASRCRISKDKRHALLHQDWTNYNAESAKKIAVYPRFEKAKDGTLRSIFHYKEYEPMFENYGVPAYIAGMNVSAIAYKTDKWNISRLDNSFQLSGIMLLDADVDTDHEAENILRNAEKKFAGEPGQVMFVIKGMGENEHSKFIPIASDNEGDWKELHDQAVNDIVVAHSWFRSLSGLDYSTGFSSERIFHEYEIALNTVILGEQEELLDPIRNALESLLNADTSSLQIINRPPAEARPKYMKIWEARKADGLPYDEKDPSQIKFLSEI